LKIFNYKFKNFTEGKKMRNLKKKIAKKAYPIINKHFVFTFRYLEKVSV